MGQLAVTNETRSDILSAKDRQTWYPHDADVWVLLPRAARLHPEPGRLDHTILSSPAFDADSHPSGPQPKYGPHIRSRSRMIGSMETPTRHDSALSNPRGWPVRTTPTRWRFP